MTEISQKLPACCRCAKCGYRSAGRKPLCPQCGGAEMKSLDPSGEGRIVDFVPVIYPPENLKHLGNYTSVYVELDNGCRMFGILTDDPAGIAAGKRVAVSRYDDASQELHFRMI